MLTSALLAFSLQGAPPSAPPPTTNQPVRLTCALAAERSTGELTTLACQGDEQIERADRAPKDSAERRRAIDAAVDLFAKAASTANTTTLKLAARETLARLYDAPYLADLAKLEAVLREIADLQPNDVSVLFRLAKVEEAQNRVEEAESTLLGARRLDPRAKDANQQLVQFYARRVAAISKTAQESTAARENPALGQPDRDGYYRVGGAVQAPHKRQAGPPYPEAARAASVAGTVRVEIFIDERGTVRDARISQSIPLLDAAALETVRQWSYTPSLLNGRPVPVKMIVPVPFTLPRANE